MSLTIEQLVREYNMTPEAAHYALIAMRTDAVKTTSSEQE
jgi:hypothetical protein